jgi:hypothetical protein
MIIEAAAYLRWKNDAAQHAYAAAASPGRCAAGDRAHRPLSSSG